MSDDATSPPPRRDEYQNVRSTSSINWRVRDDNPRQNAAPYNKYRRGEDNEQGGNPPRTGGYGRRGDREYQPRGDREYQPREQREYQPREQREYQPREQRDIPDKPDGPRLYVGNLLYTAQSSDVSNFFLDNGFNVANVSMSIDPATGRNPSYCFVDLESVEDATRAMEQLNGAEVLGRQVRINPGVAKRDGQSGAPRRQYGTGNASGWREREGAGNYESSNPRPSGERWSSNRTEPAQQYSRPQQAEQGKRIYIGGLPPIEPQTAVEAEISSLLSRAEPAIEISSVTNLIAPHPSKAGEPGDHHYLFVDLKSEGDVERAIEMFNDSDSPWNDGGRLKVNKARENRDREGRDGPRRGGRGDGGRPYGGGRGWRSDQTAQ